MRFLVDMRDHFGDAERGTSIYKVFLNALGGVFAREKRAYSFVFKNFFIHFWCGDPIFEWLKSNENQ